MSAFDVSICALTCRRPRGLARLHDSLLRLKLPTDVRVEWVLVDNDPAGSAIGDADRVDHAGSIPIRWLHEASGNIAQARNRAVEAARGEWIAWIDDDETACEDWLGFYLVMAERFEADGFFGPVLPRLEEPSGTGPELERFFARRRAATGSPATLPRSGNAFVRRRLHVEHAFDPRFGTSFGEDADCFLRAADRGARFVWCDEACVEEWIPPERHSADYLADRAFASSAAWARIDGRRRGRPRPWRLSVAALRFAVAALLCAASAVRSPDERLAARLRLRSEAGRLHGIWGPRAERGTD